MYVLPTDDAGGASHSIHWSIVVRVVWGLLLPLNSFLKIGGTTNHRNRGASSKNTGLNIPRKLISPPLTPIPTSMNMQKLIIMALFGVSAFGVSAAEEPICCKDCPENKHKYYSIANDSGPWLCGETCIRNVSVILDPTISHLLHIGSFTQQHHNSFEKTSRLTHTLAVFLSDISHFREESYEKLLDELPLRRCWIHDIQRNGNSRWRRSVLYFGSVCM